MTTDNKSLSYDEKNQQDFMAITEKIADALTLMQSDRRIKRSEAKLAELSGVSRGTLRNRVWPLQKLKALKEQSKAQKVPIESNPCPAREQSRVERYQEQLSKNRDELLVWKYRHDTLRDQVATLEAQRDAYKTRLEQLELHMRKTASSIGSQRPNNIVVAFPLSDTGQGKDNGQ